MIARVSVRGGRAMSQAAREPMNGCDEVVPVPERCGRGVPDEDVADHPTPDGRDDAQGEHPDDVESNPPRRRERAVEGEGQRAEHVEGEEDLQLGHGRRSV